MYDFDEFEDFYGEPSEYDQMINDLKRTLMRSVKQEVNDEMDRLKAENAELQEVKEKWDVLVREYKEKEFQMRHTIEEERRNMARMRLADLFEVCGMNVTLYAPDPDYVCGPKCDKCDENRYIHFNSPSGKKMREACECSKQFRVCTPISYRLASFSREKRNGADCKIHAIYEEVSNDYFEDFDNISIKRLCEKVYAGEDFESIYAQYKGRIFFEDEAKCREYCDYINAVNKVPEDVLEIARKTANETTH